MSEITSAQDSDRGATETAPTNEYTANAEPADHPDQRYAEGRDPAAPDAEDLDQIDPSAPHS